MNVLVACEFSARVRDAFRKKGHNAWSIDLLPTEGDPAFHKQRDIIEELPASFDYWDLMIAFPPCTHLAVSGARYFAQKRADGRQQAAIDFFMELALANIPKVVIENPVGIMSTLYRRPDQVIQPWMFGHPEAKATCLWLRGCPPPPTDHGAAQARMRVLVEPDALRPEQARAIPHPSPRPWPHVSGNC